MDKWDQDWKRLMSALILETGLDGGFEVVTPTEVTAAVSLELDAAADFNPVEGARRGT